MTYNYITYRQAVEKHDELSEETKIEYALIDIVRDDADNMLVSAKYFRKEGMQ